MELIIKNNHIISEIEKAEERLALLLNENYNREEMLSFINSQENIFFYLNDQYKLCAPDNVYVSLAWIDTGYVYKGEAIFISLKKYSDCFYGYFVGTASFFFNGLIQKTPRLSYILRENLRLFKEKYGEKELARSTKHIEVRQVAQVEAECSDMDESEKSCEAEHYSKLTYVTQEIYDSLLFPCWRSINGLDRYVKIVGKRVEQLAECDGVKSFIMNELGDAIVNTGLINSFGRDVLVLYRLNYKYGCYMAYKLVYSKNDYIEAGFTKEQAVCPLKPISFFDGNDMWLKAEMSDFDISHRALVHIVEERRNRFPHNLQAESSEKIATQLWDALARGLKMTERDMTYAKASYSAKTGEISWMLPFHINRALTEEPELVIVISKTRDFYEVKTVLPYDDCTKDKLTALSLFSKVW